MPRESKADRKKRTARIIAALKKRYPDARCALDHANPLELLVATILSAQCTDARVNIVTKDLFEKYRSPRPATTPPPTPRPSARKSAPRASFATRPTASSSPPG